MYLALLLVALLAYCASAALRIAKWGPRPWVIQAGGAFAVLAVLAHLSAIACSWVQSGRIPLSDSGDSVALISVGIGIGALLLQPKERGEVLAGVLSSLAAVPVNFSTLPSLSIALIRRLTIHFVFPICFVNSWAVRQPSPTGIRLRPSGGDVRSARHAASSAFFLVTGEGRGGMEGVVNLSRLVQKIGAVLKG